MIISRWKNIINNKEWIIKNEGICSFEYPWINKLGVRNSFNIYRSS